MNFPNPSIMDLPSPFLAVLMDILHQYLLSLMEAPTRQHDNLKAPMEVPTQNLLVCLLDHPTLLQSLPTLLPHLPTLLPKLPTLLPYLPTLIPYLPTPLPSPPTPPTLLLHQYQ